MVDEDMVYVWVNNQLFVWCMHIIIGFLYGCLGGSLLHTFDMVV